MTSLADRDPTIVALMDTVHSVKHLADRWLLRRIGNAGNGVTLSRLNILFLLHEHGPMQMSELARHARVAPRSVTALVDGLEREGLARRQRHPTDRRVILIEMTEAGAQAVRDKSGPYWSATSLLYEVLEPHESALLLSIYERWFDLIRADLRRMGDAVEEGAASAPSPPVPRLVRATSRAGRSGRV